MPYDRNFGGAGKLEKLPTADIVGLITPNTINVLSRLHHTQLASVWQA